MIPIDTIREQIKKSASAYSSEGCADCPFKPQHPMAKWRTCGSAGPRDSRLIIVGEAPGDNEIREQSPFVGTSGTLLFNTLQRLGFEELDIVPRVINAMRCQGPKSKLKDPKQTLQAAMTCRDNLMTEISGQTVKPDLIIALGASASCSLHNQWGIKITQSRGTLTPSPLANIGILRTLHPAFLLRNAAAFSAWVADLKYAINLLKDGKKKEPRPSTYFLIESADGIRRYIEEVAKKASLIACDVETMGFRYYDDKLLCLGITTDISNGQEVAIIPAELLYGHTDLLSELMGQAQAKYIWHNGKFDIKFLWRAGISSARVDEDTMLQSYALNENRGFHGLETVAADRIGAPDYKDMLEAHFPPGVKKGERNYGMLPEKVLHEYLKIDVTNTFQIHQVMRPLVAADKALEKLYSKLLIPASDLLAHVECEGLILDQARCKELGILLLEEAKEPENVIRAFASKYGLGDINLNSPKQVQELLYVRMRLAPVGTSTDADHLKGLAHPAAKALLEYRNRHKRLSTFVTPMPEYVQQDGRIHPTFLIHGTVTGRLASSDPNMQNIPRGLLVRSQFVAPPGYVIVEMDLNQAELRSLAMMSGDKVLVRIYRENKVSIHHVTSVSIFGEDYDEEQKMRAKAVNFGIVYGRQAGSLAEEFDISTDEAQRWIDSWGISYPDAWKFIQQCRRAPSEGRTMVTVFGRKRRFGVISNENRNGVENEASNFPHQSTASDINLEAAIRLRKPLRENFDARIFNLVHDSNLFYCPDDPEIIAAATKYAKQVIEQVPIDMGLTVVPFVAEAKVGKNWGELKSYKIV